MEVKQAQYAIELYLSNKPVLKNSLLVFFAFGLIVDRESLRKLQGNCYQKFIEKFENHSSRIFTYKQMSGNFLEFYFSQTYR